MQIQVNPLKMGFIEISLTDGFPYCKWNVNTTDGEFDCQR